MGFLSLLKICLAVCVWMWTLWPASARAEEQPALPSDYEGLREAGIRSLNQGDLSLARQCGLIPPAMSIWRRRVQGPSVIGIMKP